MKKLIILCVVALAAVTSFAAPNASQTKCPIKGGDIDKEVYVDIDGKRVYFCCPGCDGKFLKDGKANIKKMEAKGIALASAICPVSDEEADADLPVTHKGKTYYLCCKKCLKKFKANPDKYTGKKAAATHKGSAKGHGHDKHKGHDH